MRYGRERGRRALAIYADDVQGATDVRDLVNRTMEAFGRVDAGVPQVRMIIREGRAALSGTLRTELLRSTRHSRARAAAGRVSEDDMEIQVYSL